jgi:hypothetical protein
VFILKAVKGILNEALTEVLILKGFLVAIEFAWAEWDFLHDFGGPPLFAAVTNTGEDSMRL